MTPIFSANDYKQYLKLRIKENSSVRGYKTQLAQAAGCQKSFLSRVLTTHVHLTPEHAMGLAVFWSLNALERDYFLCLVDYARAGSRELSELLKEKLRAHKIDSENLVQRFETKGMKLEEESAAAYYSSWIHQAVFFIIGIPRYSTTKAIAERLEVPADVIEATIETLIKLKLIERTGDKWIPTSQYLHVSRESYLSKLYHSNWLQRAAVACHKSDLQNIHFTALYSLSRKDFEELRQFVFSLIDSSRKILDDSPEEELICMCLDLFKV